MKKLLIITLLLNSIIIFGQTKWESFTTADYSIEYPQNWDLDKSGQMGASFYLFSKLKDKTDKFRENINLLTQDLTGLDITLDKYVEISENQIATIVTNGKVIESKRVSDKEL